MLAEGLYEQVLKNLEIEDYKVAATFESSLFENKNCKHPFYERNSLLVLGDHVTLEAGTGCVHTAPGHGQDDYLVGLKYGLEIYNPVDDYGRYRQDMELFGGMKLKDANQAVNDKLSEVGALLSSSDISHSYPHCWRCKKPIIFRATEQWFISMDQNDLRQKALKEIDQKVEWIPSWGRDRIYNMVEGRPDWCISRQRSWGVPITVAYCEKCGEALDDGKIMHHIADQFEETGSDIWFEKDASELLPEGTRCPSCDHDKFTKESDILDVWFDSGVSHAAVCEHRDNLDSPADLYLEGSDQHRGWFHSSLLESVGTRDRAPYKAVLTHGFVLDKDGRPMSKSMGNVIAPEEIIKKYGAEILRLWVAATDYRDDIRLGQETLQRLSDAYRRIRNTARYLLGNLNSFDPATDMVPDAELLELDRWALSRLARLIERVENAYNQYEFHVIYHAVHNFCSIDLSAFYLDILKDRLYTSPKTSVAYRSARTTMYRIVDVLTRILAPVLSFTADEIWQRIPGEREDSVHLAGFPAKMDALKDNELEARYERLQKVRSDVSKQLEIARADKRLGQSLEAKVLLSVPENLRDLIDSYKELLPTYFIVSQVELTDDIPEPQEAEHVPGMRLQVLSADGENVSAAGTMRPASAPTTNIHPSAIAVPQLSPLSNMNKYWIFTVTAALGLILDQLSKIYIDNNFALSESKRVFENFFHITYVRNPGAAFGMLSDNAYRVPFFISVSVIATVGIIWYLYRLPQNKPWQYPALGLILSGALGNLIDRLRLGEVIDFLDFHWYNYHWPAFNLADSAICVGVGIMLVCTWQEERERKQAQ